MKVPRPAGDLEHQLREQMEFLKASARTFDEGFVAEAKRLAGTIRLLVHDTSNSRSLLGQLGLKERLFLSTATPIFEGNLLPSLALVIIEFGPGVPPQYVARLDNSPTSRWLGFE